MVRLLPTANTLALVAMREFINNLSEFGINLVINQRFWLFGVCGIKLANDA